MINKYKTNTNLVAVWITVFKKLRHCKGNRPRWCAMSVKILSTATQLYEKKHLKVFTIGEWPWISLKDTGRFYPFYTTTVLTTLWPWNHRPCVYSCRLVHKHIIVDTCYICRGTRRETYLGLLLAARVWDVAGTAVARVLGITVPVGQVVQTATAKLQHISPCPV